MAISLTLLVENSARGLGVLGEHGGFGRLQHAVEAAQDGEREDDLAVVRLLVIAAEEVGDGPNKGGEVGIGHGRGDSRRRGLRGQADDSEGKGKS